MSNWYILQVYSGNEKKIEKELLAQVEKKGLKNNIEKILIPSEEVIEMKKGKKVSSERKFFPGYMLIQMIMDESVANQGGLTNDGQKLGKCACGV